MNSLWPAASRVSCLGSRNIFQTCHKIDSLAARLAQRSVRPYSIHCLPFRQKDAGLLRTGQSSRIWQAPNSYGTHVGVRGFASKRIITQFRQLPRNYRDEDGLLFRAKDLSEEEARAIFGKVIDAGTANRMVRVLHGRRVAGTLGDPYFSSTFEEKAIEAGLQWLRENVPVNEIECAGQRAEKELAEMEADIVTDAERLGIYKPNSGYQENVYGTSGLDAIRKSKERELDRREAEAKKPMSQADEIRRNTGTLEKLSARSRVELQRPSQNPKLKYYIERATMPGAPPEMTKFQRLWPSGLVVLGVIIASYIFTQVYTPPKNSARIWPDMPPSAATIISIFIMNSIILGAWRIPPLYRVLNKYFITVPGYPRPLSLIGSIFSHQAFYHFAMNMAVLWFVGTRLHDEVGRANFLAIYMCCGAVGSFASLATWVLKNNFVSSTLGASGALCGIVSTYLLLNSSEKITFFGLFPPENWPSITAMGFLVFLIGLDVLALGKGGAKIVSVDHYAHLGGYAAGFASAGLLKLRAKQRREAEIERRKKLGIIDRIREGRV